MGLFLEKVRTETILLASGREVTRDVRRCKCGAEILLTDPMDNDCDECGRIYNMSGQQVTCHARDIDPLDAGETWEED